MSENDTTKEEVEKARKTAADAWKDADEKIDAADKRGEETKNTDSPTQISGEQNRTE